MKEGVLERPLWRSRRHVRLWAGGSRSNVKLRRREFDVNGTASAILTIENENGPPIGKPFEYLVAGCATRPICVYESRS